MNSGVTHLKKSLPFIFEDIPRKILLEMLLFFGISILDNFVIQWLGYAMEITSKDIGKIFNNLKV